MTDPAQKLAVEVLDYWSRRLSDERGLDLPVFDCHLHAGNDRDGMVGDPRELRTTLAGQAISGGYVFCLDEPDGDDGFRAANDRTLRFAAETVGLLPLARLDLGGFGGTIGETVERSPSADIGSPLHT